MNTKEKIEVMQAYEEGKTIQVYDLERHEWMDCHSPAWNWLGFDYRIKPSTNAWRPYDSTEEMIEDFRRKVGMGQPSLFLPAIWIKANDGFVSFISEYGSDCIWRATCQESITMNGLFRNFTYLDGSPCGMKED